jgi:hypothetical protein
MSFSTEVYPGAITLAAFTFTALSLGAVIGGGAMPLQQ